MVSEKVKRILVSRGAPFTDEEMDNMSDRQGWDWIYASRPPKRKRGDKNLPEICFTGFGPRKAELKAIAENNGFKCVTKVTKNLRFLCIGDAPGPAKLKEAEERDVSIISEEEFLEKIEKG